MNEVKRNKKLTIEEVKEQIEKEGYKLLSKEYINSKAKIRVECPYGHIYQVTSNHFRQGSRCPMCSGVKRLTSEFVKEQIEKEGYKLLSDEYKNTHIKLNIQCDKGHIFKATWSSFQQGQRCPVCAGNKKLTIEYIKEQMEVIAPEYKLHSTEYKNNSTELEFECSDECRFYATWNHFQSGKRCPCERDKKRGFEFVKGDIEKCGYTLLSDEYVNGDTKLDIICNKGHKYQVCYFDFIKGKRCPFCSGKP